MVENAKMIFRKKKNAIRNLVQNLASGLNGRIGMIVRSHVVLGRKLE